MMTKHWTDDWTFRTELYNFFASCLLEWFGEENHKVLTQNFWENFTAEAVNPQLEAGLKQLIACTSRLEKLQKKEALEKAAVEYTELFIGTATPKAPLIESYYFSNKKAIFDQKTIEMRQLLNKHGLESTRKYRHPEDHLGLQLLFIAKLTSHLHTLHPDKQTSGVKEQITFINDHLLSWIPGLCNDAKEHGTAGFYGGLIELIWGTLLWDIELLNEFVEEHIYVSQDRI